MKKKNARENIKVFKHFKSILEEKEKERMLHELMLHRVVLGCV